MKKTLSYLSLASLFIATSASADIVGEHYTIKQDVPYAQGLVTVDGEVVKRDLVMDVVQPNNPLAAQNPVVFMTYGGNFIRGGRDDVYSVSGAQTSTMVDYCKAFSKVGYTCVAIEYRLSGEEPIPANIGYEDISIIEDELRHKALHDRHNMLRTSKGLEPLPSDSPVVRNSILAATEDLYKAIAYVRENADELGIDPKRVALGGFSAGAMTSYNVAYSTDAEINAVIGNSSMSLGFEVYQSEDSNGSLPPALINIGQYDIEPLIGDVQQKIAEFQAAGINVESTWVPGFGHFYPMGALTLSDNVTREPLIERIIGFLNQNL